MRKNKTKKEQAKAHSKENGGKKAKKNLICH
jgi:hypothetical protein